MKIIKSYNLCVGGNFSDLSNWLLFNWNYRFTGHSDLFKKIICKLHGASKIVSYYLVINFKVQQYDKMPKREFFVNNFGWSMHALCDYRWNEK